MKIVPLELIEVIFNNLEMKVSEMIKKEIRISKILDGQEIKRRKR